MNCKERGGGRVLSPIRSGFNRRPPTCFVLRSLTWPVHEVDEDNKFVSNDPGAREDPLWRNWLCQVVDECARGRAFHKTALQYTGLLHPPVGTVDKLGQVAALPGSFSNSPELHSYVLENSARSNSLFAIPHR